jgi:hypothetical protein
MRGLAASIALLACAACSQQDAPADEIVKTAEKIVDPSASAPPIAKGRYAPQDTCAKVEGADEFRRQLAAAVRARDASAFVALAASDIKLDFGGGAGTAELRKRLGDKSWDLWHELDELMTLGCSANEQGGITIPWFFDQDLSTVDQVSGMLVTGEDVPVLADPDTSSRQLESVSWDIVEIATLDPESEFQRVELGDKTVGFIATDKLRSLLDYRLIASSRNGNWRITSFVAGD